MIVLRSMIFVPGNSMRMITKTTTLPSDAVILDLEDAVPLPDKTTARIMVRDSIKPIKSKGHYVVVRVNALSTNLTEEDLKTVVTDDLDSIMLAKTESKDDVEKLHCMLDEAEKRVGVEKGTITIIPLIESTKGVVNAFDIISSSKRIIAVAFGAGDYYRDVGRNVAFLSSEETELLYARSHLVNTSTAAGVQAIDTPFLGILTDKEGFQKQTLIALRLGFKGKMMVHPAQLEFINKTFSPTQEEAEYSQRLVTAFEEAQKKGLGAISFEGKMVDFMSYKQAEDIVKFADIIREEETRGNLSSSISLFEFFNPSST